MDGRNVNNPFNAQEFLALSAERFIDYIDQAAGNDVMQLFEWDTEKRFLLEDDALKNILKDSNLQEDLNKKLTEWQFVVCKSAIAQAVDSFRDYYFSPIASHPKWQAFAAKHQLSQITTNTFSASFFFWMFQPWLDLYAKADPTLSKKTSPLIKILNNTKNAADVCNEFEATLSGALQRKLNGFFLSLIDREYKKDEVSIQTETELLTLQSENKAIYKNIKPILWKRIEVFLANKMRIENPHLRTQADDAIGLKRLPSYIELKSEIKNEIAKGILKYFINYTTLDERASEKNHATLTNIFNALYLQVSKDKHKKYATLFANVTNDAKESFSGSVAAKRNAYGKQRELPTSQTVSDLKATSKHSSNISMVSSSAPQLKMEENNNFSSDASELSDLPEIVINRKMRIKPITSPRATSHFRHDSFFAKELLTKDLSEKKKEMPGSNPSPSNKA